MSNVVGGNRQCNNDSYWDEPTTICQKCTNCCPPRPINEYCREVCQLEKICQTTTKSALTTEAISPVVVVVGCCVLVAIVIIAVISIIKRKIISKLWSRRHLRNIPASSPAEGDVNTCQLINGRIYKDIEINRNTPELQDPVDQMIVDDNEPSVSTSRTHLGNHFISIPSQQPPAADHQKFKYSSLPPSNITHRGFLYTRGIPMSEESVNIFERKENLIPAHQCEPVPVSTRNTRGLASAVPSNDFRSLDSIQCQEDLEKLDELMPEPVETHVKMLV